MNEPLQANDETSGQEFNPELSVLIVDDTPENLVALEVVLDDVDCTLVTASSGNEALGKLLKQDFALVLLDVQMPRVDGFEVLRRIRETSNLPVMFLSGDKHHTEMLRANREGAYPLYEMTCSPLTAGTHSSKSGGDLDNPRLVKGSLVNEHNYCRFSFSGPRTDRRLKIDVIGKEGQQYWSTQIKSSVLSYNQVND